MKRAAGIVLVMVFIMQVCWLGETWWWTVATMVVGAFALDRLLGPEFEDGDQGEGADPADDGQGAEQPRQQVGDQGADIDTGGAAR